MNIRPVRNLALVEVLPRLDEVQDYEIKDGRFVDLSETPVPLDQVVAVREWRGGDTPQPLRYCGERNMPQIRRAKVLAVGPDVTDISPGDIVLVGIFAGLEIDDGPKDVRFITEKEVLLREVIGE